MDYPFSLPSPSGLTAEWYAHLAKGELRFQVCSACDRPRHPPRVLCARCGSSESSWALVEPEGEIFSWTVSHRALHPDFAAVVPYSIVVVELRAGVRIVCSTREIANEDLRLGLPVRIEIKRINDEIGLPYACPASGSSEPAG